MAGKVVTLKLRDADFRTITRRRKLAAPESLADPILRTAVELLDANWDRRPVRLIGVGVTGIVPDRPTDSLFPEPEPQRRGRSLARTIDRIQDRFGSRKVVRANVLRRDEE
ncbi:MAG: hypothetical protein GF346_00385 [Candidatus Eisenbacteria bacterium]|nr:hypothetical protein [Candidatus Latescibacterota bacterium]MBD3300890.1 hypothetical protein [Candidatus Eisenbacteria bacterium]